MLDILKKLCTLDGPSGNEDAVREFILGEIFGYCDTKVDANGNIIAFKKGKSRAQKKVMLDAHMDEVGIIVTDIDDNGFLRFAAVGGIETEVLLCSAVKTNDCIGVIGLKPVHQSTDEERRSLPKRDSLYIDIGATDKKDAEKYVTPGDIGTFVSEYRDFGDSIVKAKALDDRVGCAILISLLKQESDYDFYATFTVGEELGLRGATTAAYTVEPDYSIVLEATTAADINGTPENKKVCEVGKGAVVSFMDNSTLYNRRLFDFTLDTAKENGISAQTKNAVAGGNNAGAIHLSRGGVKTITLSLPCRYIHSPSTVASVLDMEEILKLARIMCSKLASGEEDI